MDQERKEETGPTRHQTPRCVHAGLKCQWGKKEINQKLMRRRSGNSDGGGGCGGKGEELNSGTNRCICICIYI